MQNNSIESNVRNDFEVQAYLAPDENSPEETLVILDGFFDTIRKQALAHIEALKLVGVKGPREIKLRFIGTASGGANDVYRSPHDKRESVDTGSDPI